MTPSEACRAAGHPSPVDKSTFIGLIGKKNYPCQESLAQPYVFRGVDVREKVRGLALRSVCRLIRRSGRKNY